MKQKARVKLLLIGLFFYTSLYAQTNNDTVATTYSLTRIVPRFGYNAQKGYGIECGLSLNRFDIGKPRNPELGLLPYSLLGIYISSELCLKDDDKIIIGPKLGCEWGLMGETHGHFVGMEFINYTNFEDYSPALMLKIGAPLLWFNIGYGYTIFFEDTLKEQVGKHRLTISYTINRKANKKYKQMQKDSKERIKANREQKE
jgi:hypothetical protein